MQNTRYGVAFLQHNWTQLETTRRSSDSLYTLDHEGSLVGCRSNTYRNTPPPPAPIFHTPLEGLKLLGEALIPLGFKWPKDWGEREANNLLLDTKTEPNLQIYYTKDLIELMGEHNKTALKKSIESASKKKKEGNLKEQALSGVGKEFTLVELGKGGHGGGHTFRKT